MAAIGLDDAYVLHRRAYRESSLLLELFTASEGRVPAVARGARRPRSHRGHLLNPFVPLLVTLRGRGEVRTLTQVEPSGSATPRLGGKALVAGLYVNELLVRLLPRQDPSPKLFETYAATLPALTVPRARFAALRLFEKRLLEELGYAPRLDATAPDGEPVQPGRWYRYRPGLGAEPAIEPGADGDGVLVSGRCLLALAHGELPAERPIEREALRLMRSLLAPLLGDRPLRSRELVAALPPAAGRREPQPS